MSHRSLFILVSVLLLSFSVRSQEATPLRGLDESAAAAVRKQAIELLQTVAGQVDSLRSGENRARIRSNAAEALWDHDEKRARNLFAAVEDDLRTGFDDTDSDETAHTNTLTVFWQLRSDTVGRIAKHDPELALEFLRATRPLSQLPAELVEGEKSLELSLAGQIAAKNPQLTLKLVRQSLAKGFSNDLMPLLSQLKQKDKKTARTIHKEIVDKLKTADLAQDWIAMELAMNLAQSFQPPEADEQVYRDLLGLLLASAVADGCAETKENDSQRICSQVGLLFSRIEKYYGQRATPLKRWAGTEQNSTDPSSETWTQTRELMEKGTVDEILALAPQHPGMQREIYYKAMEKAAASSDFSKARQIASNFPDDEQRREMLTQIDQYQDFSLMNADGKLALVQKQLSSLRSNEERFYFLLYMAGQVAGNDRKLALSLLSQAGQLIDSFKPGKAQLDGQVTLALMYCSLKSDRGFAIMEPLIPKLNELVAASAALDGFDNNYLRDGEWNMTGAGSVGGLLTTLAQNIGYFAALDFDRSVTLASQLDRPELRLMAQLKIAQSVLTSQPLPPLASLYRLY
jgi:hypothetical protein